MPKTHHDMRKDGKISIFLGNITDEEKLDEYMSSEFDKDFGFEIYPEDGPEASAADKRPVEELLEGFSSIDNFKEAAVKLAKEKGLENVSCAIIFYNFEYDPSLINKEKSGKVDFIGTIDY